MLQSLGHRQRHRHCLWHACPHTLLTTLQPLGTSCPSLLGISAQIQGVRVPASDSMPYSHSHSLGSVAEMVATAAGATDSNIVGMIGTKAGLSVKNAAMEATTLQLRDIPGWRGFRDHVTSLFQISSLASRSIVQHSTHMANANTGLSNYLGAHPTLPKPPPCLSITSQE